MGGGEITLPLATTSAGGGGGRAAAQLGSSASASPSQSSSRPLKHSAPVSAAVELRQTETVAEPPSALTLSWRTVRPRRRVVQRGARCHNPLRTHAGVPVSQQFGLLQIH